MCYFSFRYHFLRMNRDRAALLIEREARRSKHRGEQFFSRCIFHIDAHFFFQRATRQLSIAASSIFTLNPGASAQAD